MALQASGGTYYPRDEEDGEDKERRREFRSPHAAAIALAMARSADARAEQDRGANPSAPCCLANLV